MFTLTLTIVYSKRASEIRLSPVSQPWHLPRVRYTHSEATQCLSGRTSILFAGTITRHPTIDVLLMLTRGTRQTVRTPYDYRLLITILNLHLATL